MIQEVKLCEYCGERIKIDPYVDVAKVRACTFKCASALYRKENPTPKYATEEDKGE